MDVFQAVADPVRRSLVERLAAVGEASAGELASLAREGFGISQPATSKHLRVLREAGVVTSTVAAQRRVYRLEPRALAVLADWATRQQRYWNAKLDALAALGPDIPGSDSVELPGRVVRALAEDPDVARHGGRTIAVAALAREYGLDDV